MHDSSSMFLQLCNACNFRKDVNGAVDFNNAAVVVDVVAAAPVEPDPVAV